MDCEVINRGWGFRNYLLIVFGETLALASLLQVNK